MRELRKYELTIELPEGWNGRDGEMYLTGHLRGHRIKLIEIKQKEA
jgi:hypothetical protein